MTNDVKTGRIPETGTMTAYERWELPSLDDIDEAANEVEIEPVTAEEVESIRQEAYSEGLEQGNKKGYDEGFTSGQKTGHKEGLKAGTQEGLKSGFDQGLEKGLKKGQADINSEVKKLADVMQQFDHPLAELNEQVKDSLLNVVTAVCRTVIHRELQTDSSQVTELLKHGLNAMDDVREQIEVRVNPADLILVEQAAEEAGANWKITPDESILPGGVKLKSGASIVDLTAEHRFQQGILNLLGRTDWAIDLAADQASEEQQALTSLNEGYEASTGDSEAVEPEAPDSDEGIQNPINDAQALGTSEVETPRVDDVRIDEQNLGAKEPEALETENPVMDTDETPQGSASEPETTQEQGAEPDVQSPSQEQNVQGTADDLSSAPVERVDERVEDGFQEGLKDNGAESALEASASIESASEESTQAIESSTSKTNQSEINSVDESQSQNQDVSDEFEPLAPKNVSSEEVAPVQSDSIQNDSIQNDSIQNDSIQNDSIQNDSIQNDSIQNDLMKSNPTQEEPRQPSKEEGVTPLAEETPLMESETEDVIDFDAISDDENTTVYPENQRVSDLLQQEDLEQDVNRAPQADPAKPQTNTPNIESSEGQANHTAGDAPFSGDSSIPNAPNAENVNPEVQSMMHPANQGNDFQAFGWQAPQMQQAQMQANAVSAQAQQAQMQAQQAQAQAQHAQAHAQAMSQQAHQAQAQAHAQNQAQQMAYQPQYAPQQQGYPAQPSYQMNPNQQPFSPYVPPVAQPQGGMMPPPQQPMPQQAMPNYQGMPVQQVPMMPQQQNFSAYNFSANPQGQQPNGNGQAPSGFMPYQYPIA